MRKPKQEEPNNLIILSGPPGAGKTTISKALLAQKPGTMAYIEGDTFWNFFPTGVNANLGPIGFRTIMRAMVAASVPYALAGYEILLDFSIPPWYLEGVRKITGPRGVPVHYIVLKPGIATCAKRAQERTDGAISNYESTMRDFYDAFSGAEQYELNDCLGTPEEVAELIRNAVDSGEYLLKPS